MEKDLDKICEKVIDLELHIMFNGTKGVAEKIEQLKELLSEMKEGENNE